MSLVDVLGSAPRLTIIRELSHGPMYVSQLTDAVGMNGKAATHHLSALDDAGIVEYYYLKNRKYYRLIQTIELRVTPPPNRTFILQATKNGLDSQN